ncbi:MAG: ATP-binding protein [Pseudomonadota bacterium]|nr:ATP-binding protein [Pseudomonadota bacterium]
MTGPATASLQATEATRPRWRARFGFSIKARLVVLFLLLALATAAVFLFGTQRLLQTGWQAVIEPLLSDYADRLRDEIGSPPDVARARALADRLPITVRIDGPRVQFDSRPPGRREHRGAQHEDAPGSVVRNTADGHRIRFGLARPPDSLRPRLLGWGTLLALLALTALAYAAVRRMLRPLRAINAGVAAYGRGDFAEPIGLARRDELGLLAERIDGMAANLRGMLDAKRALLLAISHELRSPLTRARVNAELLDESPPRQALLHDLAEMRDLITNLLESERLAEGHAALQAETVDLATRVRAFVARAFADESVTLALGPVGGPLQADPVRIELLLRNLIDNALRHGAARGATPPTVFLRPEDGGLIALGVRDHGPGVEAEQLDRLGQAFYRPDGARSRATGGVGLGLALCRAVAEAHGGELRIRRASPGLEVSAVWRPQRPPTP